MQSIQVFALHALGMERGVVLGAAGAATWLVWIVQLVDVALAGLLLPSRPKHKLVQFLTLLSVFAEVSAVAHFFVTYVGLFGEHG